LDQALSLSSAFGERQASFAGAYIYSWKVGKAKKLNIGTGLRLTSMFGTKIDYTTAGPARLTRGTNIPFAVVASAQKTENWDTVTVQRPLVFALNVLFDIKYQFNPKWSAGCNIDVIGGTVGRKTSAIRSYDLGGGLLASQTDPAAKPSSLNLLLTGDNDLGSLNSEFYVGYRLKRNWELKGVYQFLFTEYKTPALKQVANDGTEIHRFRNKANNLGFAIAYHF
jgi:hypothetical protein